MNTEILKNVKSQEVNSFLSSPRRASGHKLRENIQDVESLSETSIHKGLRTRTVLVPASVGMRYKTKPDQDDGFGDPIPSCRENTLPRSNPQSRVYAAILGETIVGRVVEVHVVHVFGTHGLENSISK